MMKQIFVLLTAFCVMSLFASGAFADNGIGNGSDIERALIGIGDGSGYVTLPITVDGATGVGSVDITLYFDPTIVTVASVSDGEMDSMFANLENVEEGYARIGAYQTDGGGLDDFVVVNVVLEPISYYESCELGITVTTFKDATPAGISMAYTVSNGTYTAKRDSGGNGDNGGYIDDNGDDANVTPTIAPTVTPTEEDKPVPSPTKTLPDDDSCDTEPRMIWIYIAIGVVLLAIVVWLLSKRNE